MDKTFSFERALSYAFSAPGGAVFIPLFALVYALVGLASYGLIGWAASGSIADIMRAMEADAAPDAVMTQAASLVGWAVLVLVWSWVMWAMFETASQRRYIWHKGFSLGFGGDELRMMVVGVFWFLLGLVMWGVPLVIFIGAFATLVPTEVGSDFGAAGDTGDVEATMVGAVFGSLGLLFLLFPLYTFLATRFAPCFGQTVKEKRIRFSDAWNISRGRFWPILGAFVIISFAAGVVNQVVTGLAQMLVVPQISALAGLDGGGSVEDVITLFSQPGTLAVIGGYLFIALFMQGITQHVTGAPAALAARTDPRSSLEDAGRVDTFA